MSFAESPAQTDAERIIELDEQIKDELADLAAQQARIIEGINAIGQNVQWIVDNVQNVFAVLGNPALMSQMMGQVMGGISNGGSQDGPTAAE